MMIEKEILKENCTVLEANEKVVLVSSGEEKFVAKSNEKLEVGEKVNLLKAPFLKSSLEILIYMIPMITFLFGFGFGFFFEEELYHFLLVIGTTIFGLICLIVIKIFLSKIPTNKYIAEKVNNNIEEEIK